MALRSVEELPRRLQARALGAPREGLEAHDRPLLHAQDGLVGRDHPLAEQDVLEPLQPAELLRLPKLGGLEGGRLDGPLDDALRVEEGVVDGEAVPDVGRRGVLPGVWVGGPGELLDERGDDTAARGAKVGHGEGDVSPPLAVEEEEEAQPSRPVEAEDVPVAVVLALRLLEDLEDPLPDLLVGGRPVLVLDHGERGSVENENTQAATLGQLPLEVREPLVVGGDGLGHGPRTAPAS
jgi:hypothetical protein